MINFKHYMYDWMGGNEAIFLAVNRIRGEQYDTAMQWISWLGSKDRFPLYLAIISLYVLAVLLTKMLRQARGRHHYATGWIGVYAMLLIGFIANAAMIYTLKDITDLPRPYVKLAATHVVHMPDDTQENDDYRSFPSGHVAFTTFMVIALAPMLGGAMQLVGMGCILLVAWSRMALGMHFPADVMGAFLLTTLLLTTLRHYLYRLLRRTFNIQC